MFLKLSLISNDQKNNDEIDYFVRFENLQEDLSKIGIFKNYLKND